jgi:hypothetical protein
MQSGRVIIAVAATIGGVTVLPTCTTDDIGKECVGMNVPNPGGSTSEGDIIRAQGSEIIEYNTNFPCDDIVCVATIGSGGYCSRECASDDNCPPAFRCRSVMADGVLADRNPLSDRKYCVWRECSVDQDCGDPWTLACKQVVEEGAAGSSFRICASR